MILRVIAYFAKSLKVIQNYDSNDTLEYGVCKSLLVLHCTYVSHTVSEIFSVIEWRDFKFCVRGRSSH